MWNDEKLLNKLLNLINGPIMSTIFFMGIFLNALTIFILYSTKISAKKDSYVNYNLRRKLSKTLTNATQDSSKTILIQEEGKLLFPVDKMILHRHDEIWHTKMLRKQLRRPKIYIYLLWMSGCDLTILGCAFMSFSIPTIFDYASLGVYVKTVPIW